MFSSSLSQIELARYVAKQFNNLFPDKTISADEIEIHLPQTLQRVEYCWSKINNKYFFDGKQTIFDHTHTDQYAMFMYFLSNTIFRENGDLDLAAKAYAYNKTTLALDAYYELELPDIFYFQHPVGAVLGRASYQDYLYIYQRTSTGANFDAVYPRIREGVVLYGNSAIIGDCDIGDNVWLSFGSLVMDTNIPSNSVVFGQGKSVTIKPAKRKAVEEMFRK